MIRIAHVFREVNRCVDILAKMSVHNTIYLFLWDNPPLKLLLPLFTNSSDIMFVKSQFFLSFVYIYIYMAVWYQRMEISRYLEIPLSKNGRNVFYSSADIYEKDSIAKLNEYYIRNCKLLSNSKIEKQWPAKLKEESTIALKTFPVFFILIRGRVLIVTSELKVQNFNHAVASFKYAIRSVRSCGFLRPGNTILVPGIYCITGIK